MVGTLNCKLYRQEPKVYSKLVVSKLFNHNPILLPMMIISIYSSLSYPKIPNALNSYLIGSHKDRSHVSSVYSRAVENNTVLLVVSSVRGNGYNTVDTCGQLRKPKQRRIFYQLVFKSQNSDARLQQKLLSFRI